MRKLFLTTTAALACALLAHAQSKPAVALRDATWGFSMEVPEFESQYGRVAEFTELTGRKPAGLASCLRVSVRKPAPLAATRDEFVAAAAGLGQSPVGEKTSTIAGRDAILLELEGTDGGKPCKGIAAIVADPTLHVILHGLSSPEAFGKADGLFRACIESLRIGADESDAAPARYRNETFGFSLAPPAFAKVAPNESEPVFKANWGKVTLTISLRANQYASREKLRDFFASAYPKMNVQVLGDRFTKVSGRDAVLFELAEGDRRRIALFVLDRFAVYVATASGPAAEVTSREKALRAALDGFALLEPAAAAAPPGDRPSPTLPAPFAARPLFTVDGEESAAGTAFAVAWQSRVLILTAHHIFGDGTDPTDITPAQLPARVKELRLADLVSGESLGSTTRTLHLKGAYPVREKGDTYDCTGDLAAFEAQQATKLKPLPLATALPEPRERVWVACQPADSSAPPDLYPIQVLQMRDGLMLLGRHETLKESQLQATSGAPVVNAKGEVVGINIGGVTHPLFGMLAFINPVTSIRALLEEAK